MPNVTFKNMTPDVPSTSSQEEMSFTRIFTEEKIDGSHHQPPPWRCWEPPHDCHHLHHHDAAGNVRMSHRR
jgi:hypothetical protein